MKAFIYYKFFITVIILHIVLNFEVRNIQRNEKPSGNLTIKNQSDIDDELFQRLIDRRNSFTNPRNRGRRSRYGESDNDPYELFQRSKNSTLNSTFSNFKHVTKPSSLTKICPVGYKKSNTGCEKTYIEIKEKPTYYKFFLFVLSFIGLIIFIYLVARISTIYKRRIMGDPRYENASFCNCNCIIEILRIITCQKPKNQFNKLPPQRGDSSLVQGNSFGVTTILPADKTTSPIKSLQTSNQDFNNKKADYDKLGEEKTNKLEEEK